MPLDGILDGCAAGGGFAGMPLDGIGGFAGMPLDGILDGILDGTLDGKVMALSSLLTCRKLRKWPSELNLLHSKQYGRK